MGLHHFARSPIGAFIRSPLHARNRGDGGDVTPPPTMIDLGGCGIVGCTEIPETLYFSGTGFAGTCNAAFEGELVTLTYNPDSATTGYAALFGLGSGFWWEGEIPGAPSLRVVFGVCTSFDLCPGGELPNAVLSLTIDCDGNWAVNTDQFGAAASYTGVSCDCDPVSWIGTASAATATGLCCDGTQITGSVFE